MVGKRKIADVGKVSPVMAALHERGVKTGAAERERALLQDYANLELKNNRLVMELQAEREQGVALREALQRAQDSRRDRLAAAALTGLLSAGVHHTDDLVCRKAYGWADGMIMASGTSPVTAVSHQCASERSGGQRCSLPIGHAGPHCEGNEAW